MTMLQPSKRSKLSAIDLVDDVLAEMAEELVSRVIQRTEAKWKSLRLVDWGHSLLSGYFRLPPSRMHLWLSDELDQLDSVRGTKLNVLGPRGSAKSTLGTLAYVLRCAVEGREPYIWIVSDTIGQARTHLSHVKTELEENQLLAAYYPHGARRGKIWRRDAIQLGNGTLIEAYSTGQQLRGRRRRQHRPSLIVCDDLQNDQHIGSAMRRMASRDWFHAALLKAGDGRTNFVNFATALHRDALAMELHRSAGWRSQLFKSIETWPERMDLWGQWEEFYTDAEDPEAAGMAKYFFDEHRAEMLAGAQVLWPEHEDLYTLMRMRIEEGRAAFEREKQNSPVDPAKCEWPEEYFGHHLWFENWPSEMKVKVVALDPSKGGDARMGDYSAYVLLGVDRHDVMYVEADMARRPTPTMVDDGALICKRFNPEVLAVESNQYQELLENELKEAMRARRTRIIPIALLNNQTNKRVRIRRIGPYLAKKQIRFRLRGESKLLVDQLRDFPLGEHDDGPDAMEMAIRLAEGLLGVEADDGLGSNLLGRF